ncbi:MAG: CDP-diacylglycerol--glycerol-3-phosphate 3-phosphatidyltransferase [Eggerthellaceae bacterium]|nr:CDP-diacylglycerol--glycerol-3-phosphate 3-phosphatidyltransferase [Eggerthellaceae bacterium]
MTKRQEKLWTPANVVTVLRICGVPVFIIVILADWPEMFTEPPFFEALKPWIAAIVFGILAATDSVDGYLARSRNEVTTFGKFIDPIADKILTASALIALVELQVLPSWVVIVILCREFIVSGMRMIAASQGTVIAASWYGKAKTVFQIIAIILFILKDSLIANLPASMHSAVVWFSWGVMIIAVALTIISMMDYLLKASSLLGFGPDDEEQDEDDFEEQTDKINAESLNALASEVLSLAREKNLHIATAESLTGGLIASYLTAIAGSSDVVCGGFVTYTDQMKHELLGVDNQTLASYGAVSAEVAEQMASGVLAHSNADIAVSVTGIAGPGGAEPGKPVGTVWMGIRDLYGAETKLFEFSGDREAVRLQTVYEALTALRDAIQRV